MFLQKLLEEISSVPEYVAKLGDALKEIHPYYIMTPDENRYDAPVLELGTKGKIVTNYFNSLVVDMPFKVISLETSDSLAAFADYQSAPCALLVEHAPNEIDIYCLVTVDLVKLQEVTGKTYNKTQRNILFYYPSSQPEDVFLTTSGMKKTLNSSENNWTLSESIRLVARNALSKKYMKASELIPKRKFRVKTSTGLDFCKVNRIIRVYSKKEKDSLTPVFGGTIDLQYRFEVEGHWRKISGIGKDRKGEYIVPNNTWVIPHERGPEDAPLITKTRVITDK